MPDDPFVVWFPVQVHVLFILKVTGTVLLVAASAETVARWVLSPMCVKTKPSIVPVPQIIK